MTKQLLYTVLFCLGLSLQAHASRFTELVDLHFCYGMDAMRGTVIGDHNIVFGTISITRQGEGEGIVEWNGCSVASGTNVTIRISGEVSNDAVMQVLKEASSAGFAVNPEVFGYLVDEKRKETTEQENRKDSLIKKFDFR